MSNHSFTCSCGTHMCCPKHQHVSGLGSLPVWCLLLLPSFMLFIQIFCAILWVSKCKCINKIIVYVILSRILVNGFGSEKCLLNKNSQNPCAIAKHLPGKVNFFFFFKASRHVKPHELELNAVMINVQWMYVKYSSINSSIGVLSVLRQKRKYIFALKNSHSMCFHSHCVKNTPHFLIL